MRGLRRRVPDLDLVRAQDSGLSGATDPDVLEWAANERRVLLTHDADTLIEELELFIFASHDGEWEGQVLFLTSGRPDRDQGRTP